MLDFLFIYLFKYYSFLACIDDWTLTTKVVVSCLVEVRIKIPQAFDIGTVASVELGPFI
jgi:hypothetical protein